MKLPALVVLTLCSASAGAQAKAVEVAVLPVIAAGKIASSDLAQVESALRKALAAKRYRLVNPAQIDRIYDLLPAACTKRHCFDKIAGRLDATVKLQVSGRLSRAGADWQLDLLMHDRRRQGQPAQIVTAADRCKGCKTSELGPFTERLVDRVFESSRAIDRPAYLEIRSNPPGATVMINNVAMGVTNMTFGVSPGRHTVTLKKDGYQLSVHNVEVEPAARGKIVAELEAKAKTATPGDQDDRSDGSFARTYRWVLLGVAVAGVGAGVTLLAMDGGFACEVQPGAPAGARCAKTYDTQGAGIALSAAGAAAGVGSAILFYLAAKNKRRMSNATRLTPWTAPRAAGLSLSGTF